jgi:hypothetical protein
MTPDRYHVVSVALLILSAAWHWRTARRLTLVRTKLHLYKLASRDVDGSSPIVTPPTMDPDHRLAVGLTVMAVAYAFFIVSASRVATVRETACAACGGRIDRATCVMPTSRDSAEPPAADHGGR